MVAAFVEPARELRGGDDGRRGRLVHLQRRARRREVRRAADADGAGRCCARRRREREHRAGQHRQEQGDRQH
jgi:hypothetical protein